MTEAASTRDRRFLGKTRLRVAELDWFHDYHTTSQRRVSNDMTGQVVS